MRALRKIEETPTAYRICTDGSTDGRQENGGAGVESNDGKEIYSVSVPAGVYCSSYTGECVAFLQALKWFEKEEVNWGEEEENKVLVCTDSMSLVKSLENNYWKDKDPWL